MTSHRSPIHSFLAILAATVVAVVVWPNVAEAQLGECAQCNPETVTCIQHTLTGVDVCSQPHEDKCVLEGGGCGSGGFTFHDPSVGQDVASSNESDAAFAHHEIDEGVTVVRRVCDAAVVARLMSDAIVADRREHSRVIRIPVATDFGTSARPRAPVATTAQ